MGKLILPIILNPAEVMELAEICEEEEKIEKLEELLRSNLSDDEVIERAQELFKE